jgi:hypothetical protein
MATMKEYDANGNPIQLRYLNVKMTRGGTTLKLGMIRDYYFSEDGIRLKVTHFNGEPWTDNDGNILQPLIDDVEVI